MRLVRRMLDTVSLSDLDPQKRWLGVRVDALGNLVILAIGLASIFYDTTTNPATLGGKS